MGNISRDLIGVGSWYVYLMVAIVFSLLSMDLCAQDSKSLTAGTSILSIGNGGVSIELNGQSYVQTKPCALEIVDSGGTATWLSVSYSQVQEESSNAYKCIGTVVSENGSQFKFTDTYSLYNSFCFEVNRTVEVITANANDIGFSTKLTFSKNVTSGMNDYDFFVPGIWYKDNANVGDNALATDLTDYYYWFREDRMPLPIFMLREKNNGVTFAICHKDPDGSTFTGEDHQPRLIDGRMKFASIGMENNNQPSVGILYPGTEGERTGIWGMSPENNRWALRNHPVTQGYIQDYTLAIRMNYEDDFTTAMKNTWFSFYEMFSPSIYNCDLNQIYLDQIGLLDHYWRSINSSAGFPFRVHLNGVVDDADYNWNMGFVGQQLPNAAIMLREGINTNNQNLISKAEKIVNWWADNSITDYGCPRTWYDPFPQTWRTGYPTFTRVVGDGMGGMLWAWNFYKKNGVDKVNWLNACYRVANWLIDIQNADGSFPRSWNFSSNSVDQGDKTNTSHIIPFLVDMYKVTGNEVYKTAAINAGNYVYITNFVDFNYIGGTPDNPNVPDKEAASMALRAFLALYDTDKEQKWLDAATQTVYYYETWIYAWNVPIPSDDVNATYPKNRETTGLSLIATGQNGADSYAAIDAFNFYRMHLYTGDEHLLHVSKLLLQNTKQIVNWDRNDAIIGHGRWGILQEALTVMIPRGHGVGYYLPWQTYNMVEPLVLFWDTFKEESYDIDLINNMLDKQDYHRHYSDTRNFVNSQSETIVPGKTYVIVSRNSGKVLDVVGNSTDDGANVQQWQYNGTGNQKWEIVNAGDGFVKIISHSSEKVLCVENASHINAANVYQYSDNNTDAQLWKILNVEGGYWKIVNKNSDKVLDVVAFSKDNGANITQYTDYNTANQHWLFVEVDGIDTSVEHTSYDSYENMIIYPNPLTDKGYVLLKSASSGKLTIDFVDLTGKVVGQIKETIQNAGEHRIEFLASQIRSRSKIIIAKIQLSDIDGLHETYTKIIR